MDLENATKHCMDHVKKFDYYAFRAGAHMPKSMQAYYFGINCFFLEVLRSREISKEQSICQTRLQWWQQTLTDIENEKAAREPVARLLQSVKQNSKVNFKLLHRLV